MIKTVGMVLNENNPNAVESAKHTAAILRNNGIRCLYESELILKENVDLIISFGGDGTFLRGAQHAIAFNSYIWGVDFGRVGFLTETLPEYLDYSLQNLLNGSFEIEKRNVLVVEMNNGKWYAVNDAVISRGGYARLISVAVTVDGQSYGRYLSDGVIVATPTGSTGYSLSAGGPILSPDVDCFSVTPICPHSLGQRPLIVSADATVEIVIGHDPIQTGVLQIDGQNRGLLKEKDRVVIRKAEMMINIVRFGKRNFYDLVVNKLNEWRIVNDEEVNKK